MPMSRNAAAVKQGNTFDYEDSRRTNRLCTAQGILEGLGVKGEWTHSDRTCWDRADRRDKHVCDWQCKITWPEWTTDEMFEQAWTLADAVIDARGSFHRSAAYAAKDAQRSAGLAVTRVSA